MVELIAREMPDDYEIFDTGDWHLGAANCAESSISQMVSEIAAAPNRYIILKGDLIDAIETADKRFSLTSFDGSRVTTPHEQAKRVIDILDPIKDRILFVQIGNHEFKLWPVFQALDYWCGGMNVPWGGISAKFIALHNGEVQWKGFFAHGRRCFTSAAKDPIQKRANREAALKNYLHPLAGDCIYMSCAHAHILLCVQPTLQDQLYLADNGHDIVQHYRADVNQAAQYIDIEARTYGCSGSFLNTISEPGKRLISYSELACFPPNENGYLKITVEGRRFKRAERVVV